jgi:hypothetical protein
MYYETPMQESLPVAKLCMEVDVSLLFLCGEEATLEVRAEVVDPPQSAALATMQ